MRIQYTDKHTYARTYTPATPSYFVEFILSQTHNNSIRRRIIAKREEKRNKMWRKTTQRNWSKIYTLKHNININWAAAAAAQRWELIKCSHIHGSTE